MRPFVQADTKLNLKCTLCQLCGCWRLRIFKGSMLESSLLESPLLFAWAGTKLNLMCTLHQLCGCWGFRIFEGLRLESSLSLKAYVKVSPKSSQAKGPYRTKDEQKVIQSTYCFSGLLATKGHAIMSLIPEKQKIVAPIKNIKIIIIIIIIINIQQLLGELKSVNGLQLQLVETLLASLSLLLKFHSANFSQEKNKITIQHSHSPLPERSGIHLHNAVLHKSLGSYQLVVTSIVNNIDETSLASNT